MSCASMRSASEIGGGRALQSQMLSVCSSISAVQLHAEGFANILDSTRKLDTARVRRVRQRARDAEERRVAAQRCGARRLSRKTRAR